MKKVALLIGISDVLGRQYIRGILKYSNIKFDWNFYREDRFYLEPVYRKKLISRLKNWKPDGIIVREEKIPVELLDFEVPMVVNSHSETPIENLVNIVADDHAIGKMGAEYLLNKGFRNLAYCGLDEYVWSSERLDAFRARIQTEGYEVDAYSQPKSSRLKLSANEPEIMAKWLLGLKKPAALMACNDERARLVMEACKIYDILVPTELAVLGVNNDEMVCGLSAPPLSSIELSAVGAGYEAAEILDQMMLGKKARQDKIIVSPLYIETRASTDIMAIDDIDISASLQFIIENSHKFLQVGDVVDAANTSKRVLQKKFKKTLGLSIHKQIKLARIGKISKFLLETNMTICQIALTMNFPDTDNISRYFKKETGLTPFDYRKKYSR